MACAALILAIVALFTGAFAICLGMSAQQGDRNLGIGPDGKATRRPGAHGSVVARPSPDHPSTHVREQGGPWQGEPADLVLWDDSCELTFDRKSHLPDMPPARMAGDVRMAELDEIERYANAPPDTS